MDLNAKVDLSVRLIQEFARKFSGVYISFSGGKDSTALLSLAVEALPKRLIRGIVFIEVTGNTHELNIHYVYELCERLGVSDLLMHLRRDDLEFFDALIRWGIPMRVHRWCFNEFKNSVFQWVKPPIFLAGVKHSDSARREKLDWSRPRVWNGRVVYSPIWFWKTEDVVNYLRSRNIPLNPCYGIYGHSGNCMYCPFHSKMMIRKTLSDPYWGPKILGALAQLRNEWGKREFKRWSRYVARPLTSFLRQSSPW